MASETTSTATLNPAYIVGNISKTRHDIQRVSAEVATARRNALWLEEAAKGARNPHTQTIVRDLKHDIAGVAAGASDLWKDVDSLSDRITTLYVEQADTLNTITRELEGLAGLIETTAETMPEDETAKGLEALAHVARLNARAVRMSAITFAEAAEQARRAEEGGGE